MIKSIYLSVSPLGKVKYSPDGKYIAVSEPGMFKLYEISESLLLKVDFPVEEEPLAISFNFDLQENKTTEIALLYEEGLFRFNLSRIKQIEIFQFAPLLPCATAYGVGCVYVGTETGELIRIELENEDHPTSTEISAPLAVGEKAIVSLTPATFWDEGVNIYNEMGELLFYSRLDETLVIIEPPLFITNPDQRWSLVGLEYCWQLGQKSYSGWSATGNLYLGGPDYSVGLRLEGDAESGVNQIISVVPLTEREYLVATTDNLLKLKIDLKELSDEDETILPTEALAITFSVIYEVNSGCRVVAAYQLANSDQVNVITTII